MRKFNLLLSFLFLLGITLVSCEGPMGPAGEDGANGVDANETCKTCHTPAVVDAKAIEFEHSLHFTGEAFEEGTRTNCAPCHSHQGFTYVCENNTPATFTLASGATSYTNNYIVPTANLALPAPINCFTCHSSLHSNYAATEFAPLTNVAAVPMTMWGGSKSINFAKTDGNLCAKCHQPRPVTKSADANVLDYTDLVTNATQNMSGVNIGYRTGVHYGTQAAMAAGVGGIEFGTGYTQSAHVANASCKSCHMATPAGFGGGHSFRVQTSAEGASTVTVNFAGCNIAGCHSSMSATNTAYTGAKNDINTKLAQLAAKINALGGGNDLLFKESDGTYHGYLNIYDAGSNPTGYYKNPNQGNVAFPTITKAQFGAILNYQLIYRDGSKGVHNYPYMNKLLDNTLAAW